VLVNSQRNHSNNVKNVRQRVRNGITPDQEIIRYDSRYDVRYDVRYDIRYDIRTSYRWLGLTYRNMQSKTACDEKKIMSKKKKSPTPTD
jgi:hypothetical protein